MACYYCDTEKTCLRCAKEAAYIAGLMATPRIDPRALLEQWPLEEELTPKLRGVPDSWKRLKFALEPEEAFYWRERPKQGRLRNYGDWDL